MVPGILKDVRDIVVNRFTFAISSTDEFLCSAVVENDLDAIGTIQP